MNWRIDKRISLISVVIMAILAWIVHAIFHIPFLVAFGLAFVGIVLNGIVATIEDDAPGGFNNPDPPKKDE